MEVQLTVRYPDNATTTHRFSEEPITVGSAVANHIVLEDQGVAPHQLIIFREGGGWVVRSLAPEPAIQCEDRRLNPGETRTLGHEACMVLGPFVIEWCSEASPVGEAKELARPSATVESSPGVPAMPPLGAPAHSAAPSAPAEDGLVAAAPPAQVEAASPARETVSATADLASAFDRLDSPPAAASADEPASLRTGRAPSPSVPAPPAAATPSAPPPRDPEPTPDSASEVIEKAPSLVPLAVAPAATAAVASAATAAPPAEARTATVPPAPLAPSGDEPANPTAAAAPPAEPPRAAFEPPVTTAPPAVINPRITLNAFHRMAPFRAYPLLINVSQPATASGEQAEGAFVRVVPSLPGCLVTPPAARLDLRRAAVGMRFWVTPMVVGRQKDGWIDVAWQGAPPARLKLAFRVARQRPAKLFAFLAVVAVGLAFAWERLPEFRPDADVMRIPEVVQRYLGDAVTGVGGVLNLGYAVAGVLLLFALVAFFLRRPVCTALTASRPRAMP